MSDSTIDDWIEITEEWPVESGPDWEDISYAVVRGALAPEYANLPREQIDAIVTRAVLAMAPEEAENFWKTIGDIGKQIAPVAAQILPVAAPIVGTAIGGPLGGALGGTLGQVAGQALSGAVAPQPAPAPPRPAMPAYPVPTPSGGPSAGAPGLPSGASSAAAQLLSLIQNPALLQSLLGQVLGPAGRSAVPVGTQGVPAPFGAFMNALSTLANQAASEASERMAGEGAAETPAYLLDAEGNLRCDPAVPEERARVLMERLLEGYLTEASGRRMGDSVSAWLAEAGLMGQG